MKKLSCLITTLVLLLCNAIEANSAPIIFSGNLTYQKDIVKVGFALEKDSPDVKIWTDSFRDLKRDDATIGENFDPKLTLWSNTGEFLDENDDYGDFDPVFEQQPGQTVFDSGLFLTNLTKGNYIVTLTTYDNFSGSSLSDGFDFDGDEPFPIKDYYANSDFPEDEVGSFWRLNLEGVDSAALIPTSAVPLPAAVWMFGSTLIGFARFAKRNAINKTRLLA